MRKKRKIDSYLFDNLDILSKFNFVSPGNVAFKPIMKTFTQLDDNGKKLYTVSADITIKLRDIDKFNQVDLSFIPTPISIGIDASTIPSYCLARGNTRYMLVKPFVICASGEDAQFLLEEFYQKIKYLILISNKLKPSCNKCKEALYPHHELQRNLVNVLKHIKEGKIFADFIEKLVEIAIDYGYKYSSKSPKSHNLIIFKDGSILSNSEMKLAQALHKGKFKGLEPFQKLYNSIKKASDNGIPVVGVVKDSQALLLSKLFTPHGADYQIVRSLAAKQKIMYSYLNPIKKIIEPHKNLEIDNYFAFIEKSINPLRLEVLPKLKPKSVGNFEDVIQDAIRLIYQNNTVHEFNKNRYKLPYSILHADLYSREIVKEKKKLILEMFNMIKRRLSIPMQVKRGFE